MKTGTIFLLLLSILVSLNSLGCAEKTNQLSSDFTPIGKDTFSLNDSNLLVFYTCDQQIVSKGLEKQYTVKGNITNVGSSKLSPEVNATFFVKNNIIPRFLSNNTETVHLEIKPKQTKEFVVEKKYVNGAPDMKSYKINVLY